MDTDQRWKWAGIVSVVSIGGVLITDIVANVVGGYISEQIKTSWLTPEETTASGQAATPPAQETTASLPQAAPKREARLAAVAPQPRVAETTTVATREPALAQPEPEPAYEEPHNAATPESMPLPPPPSLELSGTVERVIDTGTLKIEGETVVLAGIKGLGSPYRDQLAKFIEEQGSQIRCMAAGERHTCFVGSVDLALAALTNGAARLATDATPQYREAADEARRKRRGIFQ